MLEHGSDAGISIVVLHDTSIAERRCIVSSFVGVGVCMWVPDDAGIFQDGSY